VVIADRDSIRLDHDAVSLDLAEFRTLLAGAGWTLERVIPTRGMAALFEATCS
jgi:hypothetical protein